MAAAGWATCSASVSVRPDEELDIKQLNGLMKRAVKDIGTAKSRVRYTMHGFVIAVGCYV